MSAHGGKTRGGGTRGGNSRRRVRNYSRLVRWMKVILPLGALALIAAIFLTARDKGKVSDLFSAQELATLGAGLKLEHPRFAGVTGKGDSYSVEAKWAVPDSAMPKVIELEKPRGKLDLADGRTVTATAQKGVLMRMQKTLTLTGNVSVNTSDGYHMQTQKLTFDLDGKTAVAPGPVTGTGPRGHIEAGSMRAEAAPGSGKNGNKVGTKDGKIWFENRVRLVFIPATKG